MSTASYFKDEAGVHLSLHLTPEQYTQLMVALVERSEAVDIYQLLYAARRHEETKDTGPGGARDIMARFDDVPPLGGA